MLRLSALNLTSLDTTVASARHIVRERGMAGLAADCEVVAALGDLPHRRRLQVRLGGAGRLTDGRIARKKYQAL